MTVCIRIAGYQDEQSVHTRAVRVMIGSLLDKIGSRVSVEFVRNISDRGRKVSDLLDLVKSGDLDICYFSSSYLTNRVPALGAFDVPFQTMGRAELQRRLRQEFGALLRSETAAKTEYEVLGFWDNGLRHLSNRARPVRTPDDCIGMKIRTLPNATYHATFRALGMNPITIDVGDMVRAISSGEVDAQENPLTNIQLFGLHKYHSYVTMTGHLHGIALVLCNAKTMSTWPEQVRSALHTAMSESTTAQWGFAADDERSSRAALEAQGVSILDLDSESRATFQLKAGPVIEQSLLELPANVSRLLR